MYYYFSLLENVESLGTEFNNSSSSGGGGDGGVSDSDPLTQQCTNMFVLIIYIKFITNNLFINKLCIQVRQRWGWTSVWWLLSAQEQCVWRAAGGC